MIYFKSDNIITSLGTTTNQNFENIFDGKIGISEVSDRSIYHEPFQASIIDSEFFETYFPQINSRKKVYTRLEKMMISSVHDALSLTDIDISSPRTGIIVSTTKGNIDILEERNSEMYKDDRVSLWRLGEVIAGYFGNPNTPMVISNACISGVLAINTAVMLIEQGKYDDIVIVGGDIVSRFVVSGFMSFLSLSPEPCKPFDKSRDGLSLGEAAATIIVGNNDKNSTLVHAGGGSANDANHISGPSRTGEGSYWAIKRALIESGIDTSKIDHISAHGTATPYNDEMESIAMDRHGLSAVPVNSMKGYIGHTLGAAGLVETALLLEEMRRGVILKSAGYSEHGVSKDIFVARENTSANLKTCLKMASGFGGSNAALLIRSND